MADDALRPDQHVGHGVGSPAGSMMTRSPGKVERVGANDSLAELCRRVIVANLERYPAEAFCVFDEDEWESIVRLRHQKTAPKEGSGGIDGTGRLTPAMSDKFLTEVEAQNPHLAESAAVDRIVWKDCVEYRFRLDGLTRPRGLELPWPLLVERLRATGSTLQEMVKRNEAADNTEVEKMIDLLRRSPMNVKLLKDTGIGKTVKKIVKAGKDSHGASCARLEKLLGSWMEMAANSGVAMKSPIKSDDGKVRSAKGRPGDEDLQLAEECQSWRQLFNILKQREDDRRSSQGKRMRERMKNLNSRRPQVVKVRPTSRKQQSIMDRAVEKSASGKLTPAGRMTMLRKEASHISTRRAPTAMAPKQSSFGAAVAFAAGPKKTTSGTRRKNADVQLSGGKRMKIPTQVVRGAGPRQLASKWKSVKKK